MVLLSQRPPGCFQINTTQIAPNQCYLDSGRQEGEEIKMETHTLVSVSEIAFKCLCSLQSHVLHILASLLLSDN